VRQVLQALPETEAAAKFGTEADVRWYLRDRRNDVPETVEKMRKMLLWRQQFITAPPSEGMVAKERAQRKVDLHPHCDKEGRAVRGGLCGQRAGFLAPCPVAQMRVLLCRW